ncbi:MAG TPA: hypothetical protein VKZ53_21835 [Candidatus Angelobacter sp.]|nr:hypothetical protein [Candidatus Angelobacter sp.]
MAVFYPINLGLVGVGILLAATVGGVQGHGQDIPAAPQPKLVTKSPIAHPFVNHLSFTSQDIVLFGTIAALFVADGITTAKIQSQGFHEDNPIARWFVRKPGGNAVYFAGVFVAVIGAAEVTRRLERDRPEHRRLWKVIGKGVEWGTVAIEIKAVQNNARLLAR